MKLEMRNSQIMKSSRLKYTNIAQFNKQGGAALFISLIMLIVLTVIGLSSMQRSNMQERMAANTHVGNMAFNSAESAIGGFVVDANTGNRLDPAHILSKLRDVGNINSQCYDQYGGWSDCDGTIFLDGDRSSAIVSQMNASVFEECNVVMCGGFSLGGSSTSTLGCRIFQVDGVGQVAATSVSNSLWAYEVTVCSAK